jgi:hypothetical protein
MSAPEGSKHVALKATPPHVALEATPPHVALEATHKQVAPEANPSAASLITGAALALVANQSAPVANQSAPVANQSAAFSSEGATLALVATTKQGVKPPRRTVTPFVTKVKVTSNQDGFRITPVGELIAGMSVKTTELILNGFAEQKAHSAQENKKICELISEASQTHDAHLLQVRTETMQGFTDAKLLAEEIAADAKRLAEELAAKAERLAIKNHAETMGAQVATNESIARLENRLETRFDTLGNHWSDLNDNMLTLCRSVEETAINTKAIHQALKSNLLFQQACSIAKREKSLLPALQLTDLTVDVQEFVEDMEPHWHPMSKTRCNILGAVSINGKMTVVSRDMLPSRVLYEKACDAWQDYMRMTDPEHVCIPCSYDDFLDRVIQAGEIIVKILAAKHAKKPAPKSAPKSAPAKAGPVPKSAAEPAPASKADERRKAAAENRKAKKEKDAATAATAAAEAAAKTCADAKRAEDASPEGMPAVEDERKAAAERAAERKATAQAAAARKAAARKAAAEAAAPAAAPTPEAIAAAEAEREAAIRQEWGKAFGKPWGNDWDSSEDDTASKNPAAKP